MNIKSIGLIGYGELGKIFSAGLKDKRGVATMSVWDLTLANSVMQEAKLAHAVTAQSSMQTLCEASDLVISAVTASSPLALAQEVAKFIRPGAILWTLILPRLVPKQQCAALVEAVGAHYVEAGVMTSVPPYGIGVPMLLGGSWAAELAPLLADWGMDAKAVSDRLGVANAIKMCRSTLIKGLEALVIERYATTRAHGVEGQVLPTLRKTFPGIDWSEQGAYFFSRVVQHGQRRAEEMREAANTLRKAGFEPLMAGRHCQQTAVGGRSGPGRCVRRYAKGWLMAGLCRQSAGCAQTMLKTDCR
ncbi:DUF1932 domain-containing protein [soil metagenome]